MKASVFSRFFKIFRNITLCACVLATGSLFAGFWVYRYDVYGVPYRVWDDGNLWELSEVELLERERLVYEWREHHDHWHERREHEREHHEHEREHHEHGGGREHFSGHGHSGGHGGRR